MKMSDIEAHVGERAHYQNLNQTVTDVAVIGRGVNKGLNKVAFVTDQLSPNEVLENTSMVGIIMWIPRDLYETLPRA